MKSRDRSLGDMIRAGLTIFLGLLILGLFVVALGGFRFWEKFDHYHARFDTVKDLGVGRPVKFEGLDVGRVTNILVDPDNPALILVELGLAQGFVLHANTEASISQKGLVGDNYVLLTLTGEAGPPLPVGATILSRNTPTLMEIGAVVGDMVTALKPRLERIAAGLETVFTPENAKHVEQILAEMESLTRDAQVVVRRMDAELAGVGGEAKSTLRTGKDALAQGNRTLVAVQQDFASLSKELREQVHGVGTRLSGLSDQVKVDLGHNQEQLARVLDQVQLLSEELTLLSQGVRERPWTVLRPPAAFPESKK